jgi:hypothetical protein
MLNLPFLAPYMLWGSLAASIPIALHFFFRSRYRTVPWAAMKFLLTSIEQTSRRLRFQELLLLLLRVALLVLLALALARPLSSTVRGAGQGEAVDAVFVFDTSYSMGGSDGSRTRFQRAQDASLDIIDQLPPHSTVQIITCSDRATLLERRSAANLDQARVMIQDLKITGQTTDLAFGFTKAAAVLKNAQASNKELYLFSDMQKVGWEQQAGKLRETLQETKEMATVNLVRCGNRPLKNVAIIDISAPTGTPRPGERVDFAVILRNTGRETVENLETSLIVDGDIKNGETQILAKLDPGETRALTMTAKLEKPGLVVLTAQVKQDDLPGDNRFDHVIEVRNQTHFLVVDGNHKEKSDEADQSSSFFLMHALLPIKETEYARYYLQPHRTSPRLASPALLNSKDLCILANVPMPPEDKGVSNFHQFLEDLGRFVREGHSLIIFGGDNVSPQAYNRILGDMYGLLPLPMKKVHKFNPKEPLKVNRNTFNLPAFLKFKDDDYYEGFANISVLKAIEVEEPKQKPEIKTEDPPVAENADNPDESLPPPEPKDKREDPLTVVLRYSNGMPAVVSRKVGAGEVILITTAAELGYDPESLLPTWSDWPLNPFYGPFLQVTLNHLLHGATQEANFVAGSTLRWFPPEKIPKAYTLIQPDGQEVRLGVPEKIKGRMVVTANELPQVGIYRMRSSAPPRPEEGEGMPGEKQNSSEKPETKNPGSPLAVIPDLRESEDLESFSDQQIDDRLGFAPRHLIAGTQTQETGADRLNREWTPLLLVLLLLLTLGESFLAWWCGRAW